MNPDPNFKLCAGLPVSLDEQKKLGLASATPPPHAVKLPCHRCGQATWIGQRQQALLSSDPLAQVACFRCAVILQTSSPAPVAVAHLGGPSGTFHLSTGECIPPADN